MTQSKDGMGRKPGGSGRLPGEQLPGATDRGGEALPMLPHPSVVSQPSVMLPSSDTNEMQDLLRRIATQIAEAEQRQGAALEGMQSRLSNLAGRAEAVTAQAPDALKPSLGSIESRIAEIAETVETVGREIKSAEQTVGIGSAATSPSMHVRGFGRGQVRGSNDVPVNPEPAMSLPASAVAGARAAAAPTGSIPATAHAPATARVAAPGPAAGPEADGPWDKQSADALAKIFIDEEEAASLTAAASPSPVWRPAPGAPSGASALTARSVADSSRAPRTEPPALASASASGSLALSPTTTGRGVSLLDAAAPAPLSPPSAGASLASRPASGPGANGAATGGLNTGVDRDWLNARFAEIASQIERSLKESGSERALSTIGPRFDKLESSLTSMLTAVRAGMRQEDGGQAGQVLSALDAQVHGLKTQIDAAVLRLASLDALKSEIAEIAGRLGALDRLESAQSQLSTHVLETRGELEDLLRTLKEQKAAGASPEAESDQLDADDARIDKLYGLFESQAAESRDNDAATVAVLQAIQGSIDQLTQRMGQFEEAVATAVLGPVESAESGPAHAQAPLAPRGGAYEPQPAAMPVEEPAIPVERPSRIASSARAEAGVRGRREAAAPAVQAEAAIPRTRRGIGNIMKSGGGIASETAPGNRVRMDDDPQPRAERHDEVEASRVSRDDMVGAARRAVTEQDATGEEPEVNVETIAARLPGQKRAKPKAARGGFFTFEKAGSRPIQLVMLVALLAAGAGMLYGTLAERPQPVRLDKPKSTVGKIGSVAPGASGARGGADLPMADAASGAAAAIRPVAGEDELQPTVTTAAGVHKDDGELDAAMADEMRAADMKEAALSAMKQGTEADSLPMHTSSSQQARAEGPGLTTGILIDSGAPMPSVRDLRRYSEEQRMARISSQLGDKAVQRTEREHGTVISSPSVPAAPVRHTPEPGQAESLTAPVEITPTVATLNSGGLPPAQIGPMSLRVAAAKGDPSAEFEVASRFAQGKGVPKDFAKAAEWYQRAASRGSAPAQYRLGGLYERGIGVKSDAARARTWYKRAAELGNVKAMHNLAVMYTQRDGSEPDYVTASQWFTRAAAYGLADSQFNLAILHENGMGVPKNLQEAYMWYSLAAERGDPEAIKRRNSIASRLTPTETERGRMAVAKWRPKPTDAEANDPMLAGQAWRARNGHESVVMPGHARPGVLPQQAGERGSAGAASARSVPQDAEIIDLSAAAIDAQMKADAAKQGTAVPAGSATVSPEEQAAAIRKRRATKAQSPGDIEKMLAQFGYNPSALKKARPGGSPEETPTVPTPPKGE